MMIETLINGRWKIKLPEHRANRPEWKTGWEVERLNALHESVKPGMVVFDVGAEEGDLSALMASWGAQMVLFEPNDRVWPNIKAIWESNGLGNPDCFAGFAGSDTNELSKEATFLNGFPPSADGEIISDHGFKNLSEEGLTLPQICLDDFPATPSIINIDVEGSEFEVLKGAEGLLSLENIAPLVFVSIHPEFMFRMHNQYSGELFQYMWALGYKHKILDFDHEWHVLFEKG